MIYHNLGWTAETSKYTKREPRHHDVFFSCWLCSLELTLFRLFLINDYVTDTQTDTVDYSIQKYLKYPLYFHGLTSSIRIANIRKPPDIAKVHCKSDNSQEKLYFLVPGLSLPPRDGNIPRSMTRLIHSSLSQKNKIKRICKFASRFCMLHGFSLELFELSLCVFSWAFSWTWTFFGCPLELFLMCPIEWPLNCPL